MRNTIHYKPSGKYSVAGLIILCLVTAVVGTILSWIYLKLNSVVTIVYLCIVFAFLVSAAIGYTGNFCVKKLKLRNPVMALISLGLGLLIANYAKWAIYVSHDYDSLYYKTMKDTTAYKYYLGSDSDYSEYYDSIEEFISSFKEAPASLYLAEMSDDEISLLSDEELDSLQNDSIWDYFDFDDILGKDASTVEKSLEKSKEMNAYDFTFEYREMKPKTVGYLMIHPVEMFKDIQEINRVGRWSYRASRTSSYSTTVNGVILWIVWLGELLILTIPAIVIVRTTSSFPFIESENRWAEKFDNEDVFRFSDHDNSGTIVSPTMLKQRLSQSPDCILDLQPADPKSTFYYTVTYCHSLNYDENYITVKHTQITSKGKNNQKNTNTLSQFILVDADYIATLYGIVGVQAPAMCKGTNMHTEAQKTSEPVQSAVKSSAVNADDIFKQSAPKPNQAAAVNASAAVNSDSANDDFAAKQLKEERKSSVVEQMNSAANIDQTTSGEMDGLDTSNIDLDEYFK